MANQKRPLLAFAIVILFHAAKAGPLVAQCSSDKVCTCADCPKVERTYREGRWFVLETANFQVRCDTSYLSATQLARHTESLRAKLRTKWLEDDGEESWHPKCQLVLHSSRQSYTAAVGRGSERTFGSSLVSIEKGEISGRRIDLLSAGVDFLSAALPHELTHVVLRDRFTKKVIPRWADEGAALLADTKDKRARHNVDLRDAVSRGETFNVAALVTMDSYPQPGRWGTFYGQSASLTEFLVRRNSPAKFVGFLEEADAKGYDSALQDCYGIKNLSELNREWRRQLRSGDGPT